MNLASLLFKDGWNPHPSDDAVLKAISRLGGDKIGRMQNEAPRLPVATDVGSVVHWGNCKPCARSSAG